MWGRGEWAADRQHGRGSQLRVGGAVEAYCGEWQDGREHGWGVYYARPPAPPPAPDGAAAALPTLPAPNPAALKTKGKAVAGVSRPGPGDGGGGGGEWFMLYVGRFERGCPTNGIRLEGPPPPVGGRLGAAAMACLLGDVDERAVDAAATRVAGEGLHLSAVRTSSS